MSVSELQQSIREVRTVSYLLHPPLLDEAGLGLALQSFVEGFVELSEIAVDLELRVRWAGLLGH